jgi:hypothetical protein
MHAIIENYLLYRCAVMVLNQSSFQGKLPLHHRFSLCISQSRFHVVLTKFAIR